MDKNGPLWVFLSFILGLWPCRKDRAYTLGLQVDLGFIFQNFRCGRTAYVAQHDYEMDSLCYFIKLSYDYWKATGICFLLQVYLWGITGLFDTEWRETIEKILETWLIEQKHNTLSQYTYPTLAGDKVSEKPYTHLKGHQNMWQQTIMGWDATKFVNLSLFSYIRWWQVPVSLFNTFEHDGSRSASTSVLQNGLINVEGSGNIHYILSKWKEHHSNSKQVKYLSFLILITLKDGYRSGRGHLWACHSSKKR